MPLTRLELTLEKEQGEPRVESDTLGEGGKEGRDSAAGLPGMAEPRMGWKEDFASEPPPEDGRRP